jgi:hypothetical protein
VTTTISHRELTKVFSISVLLFLFCVNSKAMDRWSALSQIESGDYDTCIGASGEVSQYQILPSVWRQYTKLPVTAAVNPLTARNVATCIMQSRIGIFVKQKHRQPTDIEFYLLWHRPSRVNHPRPIELKRAIRFANLCEK